jgi:hypothetical protein
MFDWIEANWEATRKRFTIVCASQWAPWVSDRSCSHLYGDPDSGQIKSDETHVLPDGLTQRWFNGRSLSLHPHAEETRDLNISWNLSKRSVEFDKLFQTVESIAFPATDPGIWGHNTNSNVRCSNLVREWKGWMLVDISH